MEHPKIKQCKNKGKEKGKKIKNGRKNKGKEKGKKIKNGRKNKTKELAKAKHSVQDQISCMNEEFGEREYYPDVSDVLDHLWSYCDDYENIQEDDKPCHEKVRESKKH
ncbi:uncharacterized protein LOC143246102 [Tachypleus tridentatus]|uniref:uncharacterized protein LOC143246102 n=1 Tax=Tachypleus tridentatus TaxID=6853 RepID=UPI003FD6B89E